MTQQEKEALWSQWQGLPSHFWGKWRHWKEAGQLGRDDFLAIGHLALWECLGRFDPDRGEATFGTFAYRSVFGKLLESLKHTSVIYFPASKNGRAAEQACHMVDMHAFNEGPDALPLYAAEPPDSPVDEEVVARAMARLPSRCRETLRLRFWEGRTLEECRALLGVSRQRVSQLELEALDRLDRLLSPRLKPPLPPDGRCSSGKCCRKCGRRLTIAEASKGRQCLRCLKVRRYRRGRLPVGG